jgi:hypothetical protein
MLILYAVYALSARFSNHADFLHYRNERSDFGERFFHQAQKRLEEELGKNDVELIQALVLLCVYALGCGQFDLATCYLKQAVERLCSLGFLCDEGVQEAVLSGRLPSEQVNDVRRVFWSCLSADYMLSVCSGSPPMMSSVTPLQHPVVEEVHFSRANDSLTLLLGQHDFQLLQSACTDCIGYNYLANLTLIGHRLQVLLSGVLKKGSRKHDDAARPLGEIERELQHWFNSLPPKLRLGWKAQYGWQLCSYFVGFVHLTYYFTLLNLYRTQFEVTRNACASREHLQEKCISAAEMIVHVYSALPSVPDLTSFPMESYIIHTTAMIYSNPYIKFGNSGSSVSCLSARTILGEAQEKMAKYWKLGSLCRVLTPCPHAAT